MNQYKIKYNFKIMVPFRFDPEGVPSLAPTYAPAPTYVPSWFSRSILTLTYLSLLLEIAKTEKANAF